MNKSIFYKKILFAGCFILCFFAYLSPVQSQLKNPPENIVFDPGVDSITITWNRVQGADYYKIYWGTTSALSRSPIEVQDQGQRRLTHTISDLVPDTEYFFALSVVVEFFGESSTSETQSVRTMVEDLPPNPPKNFWITDIEDITESSVGLEWHRVSDSEVLNYRIYYGTRPGEYESFAEAAASQNAISITGLESGIRYFFNITTIIEADDSSGAKSLVESEKAGELIVDTLPDELPPDTPHRIRGLLIDWQQLSVSVDPGNENMVDYSGVIINYGRQSGALDQSVDTGTSAMHVFSDLPVGTTWHFTGVAYDHAGNESEPTDEFSIRIEDMRGYTTHRDDFAGGCFVGSLKAGRQPDEKPVSIAETEQDNTENLTLQAGNSSFNSIFFNTTSKDRTVLRQSFGVTGDTVYDDIPYNNKIGISGGYYLPFESRFEDFYGRDNYPVFLFYERILHRYIALHLKAGYMRSSGNLRTVESGTVTGIDATFTMVPTSASINLRFPILSYVWGFAGIGPDYWYVRETFDLGALDDTSEWIGGYHGRVGVWLYNMDIAYRRWGLMLETQYSVIDRFGQNDLDLGGWIFLFGGFYSF